MENEIAGPFRTAIFSAKWGEPYRFEPPDGATRSLRSGVHVAVGWRLLEGPSVTDVRDLYHEDLDGITSSLVDITRLAGEAEQE